LLTYIAVYATAPSVLPVEVVPPVIAVEELTRSSSEDEGVGLLMEDLELGVSEALGISLSEVHAWYFRDSDKSDESQVNQDLVEEHNYGDVIENHIRSGQYLTKDIDGVLYMS
jgi:hypothetical protein